MRKFITFTTLALSLSALLIAPTTGSAGNANLENIIPNPLAVVNYQGTNNNPIKDFVHNIVKEALSDELIQADLNPQDLELLDLVDDVFVSNNLTAVMGQDLETYYFAIEMNTSEFERVLDTILQYEGLTESEYDGELIYSSYKRDDFAFSHRGGSLLLTESSSILMNVIDELNGGTVGAAATALNDVPSSSFFSFVFFSPEDLGAQDIPFSATSDYEWIAVTDKGSDKFEMEAYSKGTRSLFDASGFDWTDYVLDGDLYTMMPGDDPFMYFEMNDVVTMIEALLEMSGLSMTNDLYVQPEELEIARIFDGNTAFQIQMPSNQVLPFFTLVTENTGDTDSLNETLAEGINESGLGAPTGDTLMTWEYDLTQLDPEAEQFPELADFKLTYGLLDGYYVISTNPNFTSEFQGSNTLNQNDDFMSKLGSLVGDPDVLNFSYMNFRELAEWADETTSRSPDLAAETDTEEFQLGLDLLEGMGTWYGWTTVSQYDSYQFLFAQLPVDLFTELVLEEMRASQGLYEQYSYDQNYSDVGDGAWYEEDVESLGKARVVDYGYGQAYRPGDQITRAEFVTMLVRHYDLEYSANTYASDIFSDVPSGSWFDRNIGAAYEFGIASGDAGRGTFRPMDPIKRSEAVKMLENFSGTLHGVEYGQLPFNDVEDGIWYEDAVGKAYEKGIVTGVNDNSFAPNNNLTRAEAAALINRVRDNELRLFRAF